MNQDKTITIALMDPPFEATRTTTIMRTIDAALRRGFNINVFAYEGAVCIPFRHQQAHANAVHGRDIEEEDHPLPREWVAGLMRLAEERKLSFTWINCGLCVDERGVGEAIDGVARGTPADLWKMATSSINTLVVPTA